MKNEKLGMSGEELREGNMKGNIVREKSMAFAVRIVKMCRLLSKNRKEFIIARQVLRAGTSIGANPAEANCAISRKDFLAKVYIAFKECAETKYWLELLHKTGYINTGEYNSIAKDCEEIYRILSAITKTMRK